MSRIKTRFCIKIHHNCMTMPDISIIVSLLIEIKKSLYRFKQGFFPFWANIPKDISIIIPEQEAFS